MTSTKYVKAEDRGDFTVAEDGQALDPRAMFGTWLNTNATTAGINKVVLTERGSGIVIQVHAADGPLKGNWGEAKAESIYANAISSRNAIALIARFELETFAAEIQVNLNQGLLVIGYFVTFREPNRTSNYFAREFFHQ